jgi:hypothetical protein
MPSSTAHQNARAAGVARAAAAEANGYSRTVDAGAGAVVGDVALDDVSEALGLEVEGVLLREEADLVE